VRNQVGHRRMGTSGPERDWRASDVPVDESMRRIREAYVNHYDDPAELVCKF
jgi:hypothetical protein